MTNLIPYLEPNSNEFVIRLLNLQMKMSEQKNSFKDYGSLNIIRADYMLCKENQQLALIEINTIASGLASHGSEHRIGKFHQFMNKLLVERLDLETEQQSEEHHSSNENNSTSTKSTSESQNTNNPPLIIPENKMLDSVVSGFEIAYNLYLHKSKTKNIPVILFIVEEQTWNAFDQRGHEYAIRQRIPQVDIIRYNLPELDDKIKLNKNGHLYVKSLDNEFYYEVAIVYFRAGYDPSHYPNNKGWHAREMIERSSCIKCPSLKAHILTLKKVQFDLSQFENNIDQRTSQISIQPEDKFTGGIDEESDVEQQNLKHFEQNYSNSISYKFLKQNLNLTAAEIYSFFQSIVDQIYVTPESYENCPKFKKREDNLNDYVLKPMTEGGSKIFSGQDIVSVLKAESKDNFAKFKGYILMKKINPNKSLNIMLQGNLETDYKAVATTSELGIFGCFVRGSKGELVYDDSSGYILRTKYANLLYGGFAHATSALDSLYLT